MAKTTRHVVVDGSNIATEGREQPSLAQLNDAVKAYATERSPKQITVIVDATFGHRIDKSERRAFERATSTGEIVTPPAGAIGRGDAFILQVADKADAVVLSNDSFQEFHGEHPWLFDEERLVGGKPLDGIGWIFVDRAPVRGPTSRRSTKAGKVVAKSTKRTRPARKAPNKDESTKPPARKATLKSTAGPSSNKADKTTKTPLNSPENFMRFVTTYSIGDEFVGTVERFASHGCYLRAEGAQCYLSCKAMGDPPPNRARDVVSLGQQVRARVESLDSDRTGINVSLIDVLPTDSNEKKNRAENRDKGKVGVTSQVPGSVADGSARESNLIRSKTIVATKTAKKASAKRGSVKKPAAKKATPKKVAAKRSAKKATATAASSSRAKKATAKKAAPKKAAAKKAPAKKAAAKKATAKKAAPKKAAAKKAPVKKATAKKTTKKAAARKAAPKKAVAKKATAKKAAPKKAAAKKAPAKKATAKKTTKKAAARKAAPKKAAAVKADATTAASDQPTT